MKRIHLPTQRFFFLLACTLPSLLSRAQHPEPERRLEEGSIHIRVEKQQDGQMHVYERTYQADELTNSPGSSFWFSDSLGKGLETDKNFRAFRQQLEKLFRPSTNDSLGNENQFLPFNPTDLRSLLESQDAMKQFRFHLDAAGDSLAQFQFRLDTLNGPLPRRLFRDSEPETDPFSTFPFGAERVELDEKDYEVQELNTDQGKKYIITRRKRPGTSRPSAR